MKKIIRRQYRATLKQEINEAAFLEAASKSEHAASKAKENGEVLTCGLFRYNSMLFLYIELIDNDDNCNASGYGNDKSGVVNNSADPSALFSDLTGFLCTWPEMDGEKKWVEMVPAFWFDTPVSLEQWKRGLEPDKRCGRIAVVHPDKLLSYLCHHQAIVKEGLLKGDRYQSIAFHENILFSYFETPRDREVVNIKRSDEISSAITEWEKVDPSSHFYSLPEANGGNFLVISTVFDVG